MVFQFESELGCISICDGDSDLHRLPENIISYLHIRLIH